MKEAFEAQAQARVGEVLGGQWRLLRLLDIGGMAAVFEATGPDHRSVAVKVLHKLYADSGEAKRRFLEEGYVANQIQHPNTVHVHADGHLPDGSAFLVMDLLQGTSLEAELERAPLMPPSAVLIIADAVLDLLAAAHERGIIHRDIKPPNIFLTSQGAIKILDFGLARVKERTLRGELTRDGMVVGTAAYMPPEQARGKRDMIDPRTDIWALGATMYRALTGSYVHTGKGTERLIQAMTEPATPLASVAPHVPPAVCAVVDKALAFQKSDRWDSARAMQNAIHAAYQRLENVDIPSARPSLMQHMPSMRGLAMDDEEIPVSVRFESDPAGSVIVDFEDEEGHKERYKMTSSEDRPPGQPNVAADAVDSERLSTVELQKLPSD